MEEYFGDVIYAETKIPVSFSSFEAGIFVLVLWLEQQSSKLHRVGGLELHQLVCHGMIETELEGVKSKSVDRIRSDVTTISTVANQRVAEALHVHANLVLATCLQVEL
jgi:hypothetical protein